MAEPIENLRKTRLEKLEQIEKRGIKAYPPKFEKTHSVAQSRDSLEKTVRTAGRLLSFRTHGKIAFADLTDETGKIQLLFRQDVLGNDKYDFLNLLDIGDFLGVAGTVIITKAGETTIDVENYELLAKSLQPLPSQWYGLKDVEERYRKRYLDLILNREAKKNLDRRWLLERKLREFLWQKEFVEVETPILQNLYGGTNAQPFTTHLNALDQEMYLRVAPELYLKRLIVGGYEKVFEIARNFRNEGMDHAHQPEFTMLEWYIAYGDYFTVMDLVEEMMKFLAIEILGTTIIPVKNRTIDVGQPWPKKTIKELTNESFNIDWDLISKEGIDILTKKHHVEIPGVWTKNKALYMLFDKVVAPTLEGPIWAIDLPREVSPLSKEHRSDPENFVERFNGFIGGEEIFDGWSEVTSGLEQRQRFEVEQKNMRAGDAEAQPLDEDFIEALEYGMPPLGGIGFGIDRLVMFFTNTENIREVIAFPLLRPEKEVNLFRAQDFDQKFVIIIDRDLPAWQVMNTSGHIAAFLGNKMKSNFDTGKFFLSKDGKCLPRNSQYPVITLSASQAQLTELSYLVEESGLLHIYYVPEMMETTDDRKLEEVLLTKNKKDIVYAGIGVFGPKDQVDKLTKDLVLWGKK